MKPLRFSKVHFSPLALRSCSAAEYLNPSCEPFVAFTTFQRSGPILLGPPFSKAWQDVQTLACAWPLAGSALASSTGSGTDSFAGPADAAGALSASGRA